MEELPYPAFVVIAQLGAMKWPRKAGLFGKQTVAGAAVNAAWAGMVQTAMGLGAGRPRVACQLITSLFSRRDWAKESGDALLTALDPARRIAAPAAVPPWETLIRQYAEVTPSTGSWKDLFTPEVINIWIPHCAAGLIYGLMHPADVCGALDRDRAKYVADAPEAIKHGLNIPAEPPFPDNEAFFRWAEQTVRAYEVSAGPLPEPAPQLLLAAAVRARGI